MRNDYYYWLRCRDKNAWKITADIKHPKELYPKFNVDGSGNKCAPRNIIKLRIKEAGVRFDLFYTEDNVLLASKRIADILEEIAEDDICRIPTVIEGDIWDGSVIQVLPCKDVIDTKHSWCNYAPPEEDDIEDEGYIWKTKDIIKASVIYIHPENAGDHDIFCVKYMPHIIIVSEKIRLALRKANATGIQLRTVTLG